MVIELLESRIAPAAVISSNGKTATFTDVDGDLVTIAITKGDLHNAIFEFEGAQLQLIDLQGRSEFHGTDLSITAKRDGTSGDGHVDVGAIDGSGIDLRRVDVRGDLGRIDAGNTSNPAPAIKRLSLASIGDRGLETQGGESASLISTVDGSVGTVRVGGNVNDASFYVREGQLGAIYIGGDLLGGASENSGRIVADSIGRVTICGSIVGGEGAGSGVLVSVQGIRDVFVGGSILGGAGAGSGAIDVAQKLGWLTIGDDLTGGAGAFSGRVSATGAIDYVSIGGSISGDALESGVLATPGKLKGFNLGGSLVGGAGKSSGSISLGAFGDGSIGGNVVGGEGAQSGSLSILSSGIRWLSIQGDVLGGTGEMSGSIDVLAGKLRNLSLRGDLVGVGANSGVIRSSEGVGYLYLDGDVVGNGPRSGRIEAATAGYISIQGEIHGGDGEESGLISVEQLNSIYVGHNVVGGSGVESGRIEGEFIGEVSIRGSLLGGSGQSSGAIFARDFLGHANLGGDLVGGTASSTGRIYGGSIFTVSIRGDLRGPADYDGTETIVGSGSIRGFGIGHVYIRGSLIGGTSVNPDVLERCGAIVADEEIASVRIDGDVKGVLGSRFASPALISAEGDIVPSGRVDVAIGSIYVRGRLEGALIRAGFDEDSIPVNADAQIGTINVNEWIASNAVAGVSSGADGFYGTDDDTRPTGAADRGDLASRIAKVIIRNKVIGTAAGGDSYGIVAEEIGALWIGDTRVLFTSARNEVHSLARTGDLFAREDV